MASAGSSDGASSGGGPAPPAPPGSILAFNFNAKALRVPIQSFEPVVMYITRLSKDPLPETTLAQAARVPLDANSINTTARRSLQPVLIVGYTCHGAEEHSSEGQSKKKGASNEPSKSITSRKNLRPTASRGQSIDPENPDIIPTPSWIAPVVVKYEQPGEQLLFYALSDWVPKTKLCVGYQVKQNCVFFPRMFVQFAITSRTTRASLWAGMIRKYLVDRLGKREPAKQTKSSNMAPTDTGYHRSVANDLLRLFALFEETEDGKYVNEMTQMLEQKYPELTSIVYSNRELHHIIHLKEDLRHDAGEKALTEYTALWKQSSENPPTAQDLQDFGTALRAANVEIPFTHFHALLVMWKGLHSQGFQIGIEQCAAIVAQQIGNPFQATNTTNSSTARVLSAIRNVLSGIIKSINNNTTSISDQFGPATSVSKVDDIIKEYRSSTDTDSAVLWQKKINRTTFQELSSIYNDVTEHLTTLHAKCNEYLDALEKVPLENTEGQSADG